MKIKITRLRENALLPEYHSANAACMDLHACITEPQTIRPGRTLLVPTGIAIGLEAGYESQIRPRSGLALKQGITVLNGPGTVDADYRGEYGIVLINHSNDDFVVEPDMRVAQLIITRYEPVEWDEVDTLDQTERGTGGFSSTGFKPR